MSANVINKDNEGPAKKLIFPARRRLQSLALWFAVYGLLGLKSSLTSETCPGGLLRQRATRCVKTKVFYRRTDTQA